MTYSGITKFQLTWLVIWIVVSAALLVLAVLRKLALPAGRILLVFGLVQAAIVGLLLGALAHNQWSRWEWNDPYNGYYYGGWVLFGLIGTRDSEGNTQRYECRYGDTDEKNYCRTITAAGAATLAFSLIGIVTAFVLLVLVGLLLAQAAAAVRFQKHIPTLANVQCVWLQAMIMIWGVSAHAALMSQDIPVRLGTSWILCAVATVLALLSAFSLADRALASLGGAAPHPSAGVGPNWQHQQPQAYPMQQYPQHPQQQHHHQALPQSPSQQPPYFQPQQQPPPPSQQQYQSQQQHRYHPQAQQNPPQQNPPQHPFQPQQEHEPGSPLQAPWLSV